MAAAFPSPPGFTYMTINSARLWTAFAFAAIFLSSARAQDSCTVSGRIYRPDGAPASNEIVSLIKVEQNGIAVPFTPVSYQADALGNVSFPAPRNSSTWVQVDNV